MRFIVKKSDIFGTVDIPASKSHTIRALFFAALADGESKIIKPLLSEDGLSALRAIQTFGARVKKIDDYFLIKGVSGRLQIPDNVIDAGNSGTTMNVSLSIASLVNGYTVLTGDSQIRNRDISPLVAALNNIGASVITTKNNGKPPVIVKGKATGGYTRLDATSSQFLTSLLIASPLMERNTTIDLNILNEVPYVEITLWRLDKQGIKYQNDGFKQFIIQGNQSYKSFEETIPADFS
ncbi:MAG TPA: 3-phosphoshikimate 1-carboxyvinyltransferase, partial [Spirochaetota bacterium]|nr:3-phosphoshikimate 1-carboxyvinyltransferase [Spirochaetota bacterium]